MSAVGTAHEGAPEVEPLRREVRVRVGDPEGDKEGILGVLRRNLPGAGGSERYDWLYLANPHGRARVWVAEDRRTGEVVGTSAGHPKRAWMDGRCVDVLNLSDFAFDRSYRALGPALELLRASLQPARSGEFAFSYEHPSRAMLAVYQRLGGRSISPTRRWVRLLRVNGQVAKRLGDGAVSRVATRAGNLVLRARDRMTSRRSTVEVAPLERGSETDLESLDARLARATPFRLRRSSGHLRWRYYDNVTAPHEVLCARRRNELVGYLVFRPREGGDISIVDLVGSGLDDLVAAVAEIAWSRGCFTVSSTVLRESPVEAVLARNGLVARQEGAGVVVFAPTLEDATRGALQDPQNWWMLEGDEDV